MSRLWSSYLACCDCADPRNSPAAGQILLVFVGLPGEPHLACARTAALRPEARQACAVRGHGRTLTALPPRSSWQDVRSPLSHSRQPAPPFGELTLLPSARRHVSRSVERYLRWLGVRTEGACRLSSSPLAPRHQIPILPGAPARIPCFARGADAHLVPTVFSLGDHRRRMLGPSANLPPDYFSPDQRSPETDELRTKIRVTLEEEVARYFKDNLGQVAIYDANVRPLLPPSVS